MSTSATEHSMLTGNMMTIVAASPRSGYNSRRPSVSSPPSSHRRSAAFPSTPTNQRSLLSGQLSSDPLSATSSPRRLLPPLSVPYAVAATRRVRASSLGNENVASIKGGCKHLTSPASPTGKKFMSVASASLARARSRSAQKENDAMVYLDGPQIYTCAQCRTHLTSHDDIISKSFHGRRGRAYLFDQCVNVTIGKTEDRLLITGLHSVCDIFCKRCKNMVGWTYARAYEQSQKYKEGKYIIEKINLHMEESPNYDIIPPPAGERADRWRRRSMSWGTESCSTRTISPPLSPSGSTSDMIYEYRPSCFTGGNSFNLHQSL